jgi:hypothetical protein
MLESERVPSDEDDDDDDDGGWGLGKTTLRGFVKSMGDDCLDG